MTVATEFRGWLRHGMFDRGIAISIGIGYHDRIGIGVGGFDGRQSERQSMPRHSYLTSKLIDGRPGVLLHVGYFALDRPVLMLRDIHLEYDRNDNAAQE